MMLVQVVRVSNDGAHSVVRGWPCDLSCFVLCIDENVG